MNYDVVNFRGHGNGDCGAVGNNYREVDIAQMFVDEINSLLTERDISVLTNSMYQNNYEKCLIIGNNVTKKMGFELHLNSSIDESSNGIEILVPSKEDYLEIEEKIINNVSRETGLTNRGLKSKNYDTERFFFRENGVAQTFTDWYKVIREAWQQGISLSIIELGFISNKRDVDILLSKKTIICKIIANAILEYMGLETYPLYEVKKEENYKMKYAVCYCNEVDERASKLLRDYLGDETQSLDARIKMNWKNFAEKGIINVGGDSTSTWGFSTYATHWIKGDDRYSTFQLVSDVCNGVRSLDEFKL